LRVRTRKRDRLTRTAEKGAEPSVGADIVCDPTRLNGSHQNVSQRSLVGSPQEKILLGGGRLEDQAGSQPLNKPDSHRSLAAQQSL
jgi:hypothetical protein